MTVLAPGLLGASIAAAVRARNLVGEVRIWARREDVRRECERMTWCDRVFSSPEASVVDVDLVWVCAPVNAIPELVHQIAPSLAPGAIVSDVGSTKAAIHERIRGVLPEGRAFVGSHPMAGSEKSGHEFADPDLFEGRSCMVTPGDADSASVALVAGFWEAMGMRVEVMDALLHDRIVAHLSHAPHLVASALAIALEERMPGSWKVYAGPGLKDTTRVASGSVEMWRDILDQNSNEIVPVLDEVLKVLHALRDHLDARDVEGVVSRMVKAKSFRDSL